MYCIIRQNNYGINKRYIRNRKRAFEHHLGLTCDPVNGLVQIPCIERNVYAAARAFDAARFSILSDGRHFISFDVVTKVMKQTGKDLPSLCRETSLGGLAAFGDKDFAEN